MKAQGSPSSRFLTLIGPAAPAYQPVPAAGALQCPASSRCPSSGAKPSLYVTYALRAAAASSMEEPFKRCQRTLKSTVSVEKNPDSLALLPQRRQGCCCCSDCTPTPAETAVLPQMLALPSPAGARQPRHTTEGTAAAVSHSLSALPAAGRRPHTQPVSRRGLQLAHAPGPAASWQPPTSAGPATAPSLDGASCVRVASSRSAVLQRLPGHYQRGGGCVRRGAAG